MTTACSTYYQHFNITTSGAVTHRYYVRDYLGSTRAVIDESGNVLQSTAYYPSGVPLTPNSLTPQTIKLHTGKDFFDLQGAGWYDNQARYYDCLIPTFKSQDPLAEKYPWLSPYCHCANNPINAIDPDGREVYMEFNKSTNKLYLLDLDLYKKGQPFTFVDANNYNFDKKTLTKFLLLIMYFRELMQILMEYIEPKVLMKFLFQMGCMICVNMRKIPINLKSTQ